MAEAYDQAGLAAGTRRRYEVVDDALVCAEPERIAGCEWLVVAEFSGCDDGAAAPDLVFVQVGRVVVHCANSRQVALVSG